MAKVRSLSDVDFLARLFFGRLVDTDGEDAIFQFRRDVVTIDSGREAEGSRELSPGALGDPVGKLGFFLLSGRGLDNFGRLAISTFVVNSGFVRRILGSFYLLWWCSLLMVRLRVAGNDQRLLVGELDREVLLLDAGKFTFELVVIFGLFEIEARGEEVIVILLSIRWPGSDLSDGDVIDERKELTEVILTFKGRTPVVARKTAERHISSLWW